MLRFCLITTFCLALVLMSLITTSAALSGLQSAHPISTQLSHCGERIICWMGIDITQTSIEDARQFLNTAGFQVNGDNPNRYFESASGCSARLMGLSTNPTQIGAIGIECGELRISEVMAALGVPDRVGYSCDGHYIFYYGYNLVLNLGNTLAPNERVELLVLSRIVTGTYQRRWHGFALPWRYADRFC